MIAKWIEGQLDIYQTYNKHCTREHISHSPAELTYREGKVYITRFRRRFPQAREIGLMVISLSIHNTTKNSLRIKNEKSSLFAPFCSLGYPPSSQRGHLPGVDGSAATSGLIEFLFAIFFGSKVGRGSSGCASFPVTSTARQWYFLACEQENTDHYRCSALFAEPKLIFQVHGFSKELG